MSEQQRISFVVDDDPGLRRIICHSVKKAGYEARECASLSDVESALDHERPDLIFLDVGLEGCSGMDVLDMLADHQLDTSVMLVSGRGQSELDELSQSGADLGLQMLPALTKPFRSADILNALGEAASGGRAVLQ